MSSPAKLALVGAGVGVALGQFGSLTNKGETAMPSAEGAVGQVAGSAVRSAIFSTLFGVGFALMSGRSGNLGQAAKSSAIFGGVLGASLATGQVASAAVSSTIGY